MSKAKISYDLFIAIVGELENLTTTEKSNIVSVINFLKANSTPSTHVGSSGVDQHALGNGTNAGFSLNNFTSEEKTKLANLDSSKFLGSFASEAALFNDYPANGTGGKWSTFVGDKTGTTADVSKSGEIHQYAYNGVDTWTDMGVTSADTAAMIKEKYESNEDTNAFTDELKSKLEDLTQVEILDVLTSDSATAGLSAKQGKALKTLIDSLTTTVNGKSTVAGSTTNGNILVNGVEVPVYVETPITETAYKALTQAEKEAASYVVIPDA